MKERPIIFSTEMVQAIIEGRKTQTRRVVKPQPAGHHWEGLKGYKHHMKLVECQRGQFLYSCHSRNGHTDPSEECNQRILCPYGVPGDLLYVRETWKPIFWDCEGKYRIRYKTGESLKFRDGIFQDEHRHIDFEISLHDELVKKDCPQDDEHRFLNVEEYLGWKPSIYMPKRISRLWLRVKDIRVERVQDITTEQIKAEGVRIRTNDEGNPIIDISSKHSPANYLYPGELDISSPPILEDRLFDIHWRSLWDSINADRGYLYKSNPWVWVVEFEVVSTTGKPEEV